MPGDAAVSLPEEYTLRHARDQDAEAVIALLNAFDDSFGAPRSGLTVNAVRASWADLDMAHDTWAIAAPDDTLAAYGEVNNFGAGKLVSDGYVHPSHRGKGIGSWLIRRMEARARELVDTAPAEAQVELTNGVLMVDVAARALLEREGFALCRVFHEMRITLTEPPTVPALPAGLRLRAFTPGQDERAVFDTVEAAFADHWNHTPRQFDEWLTRKQREGIDPALWLLVEAEDGSIPAVSLGSMRDDLGFITTVGTLRAWRGKGLASALLMASFLAFWERGMRTIALGVDAQNPTGATRVYEAAGMRAAVSATVYQKILRPGVDLATVPNQAQPDLSQAEG